jgi:hypothetical protein
MIFEFTNIGYLSTLAFGTINLKFLFAKFVEQLSNSQHQFPILFVHAMVSPFPDGEGITLY